MHSVIVDEELAADLDSQGGEAEVWDDDGGFLGAFVPAPGGVPGPEWADEEEVRNWVVAAATLCEKLRGMPGELKLRDPAGRLLGWFVPASGAGAEGFPAGVGAGSATADRTAHLKAAAE